MKKKKSFRTFGDLSVHDYVFLFSRQNHQIQITKVKTYRLAVDSFAIDYELQISGRKIRLRVMPTSSSAYSYFFHCSIYTSFKECVMHIGNKTVVNLFTPSKKKIRLYNLPKKQFISDWMDNDGYNGFNYRNKRQYGIISDENKKHFIIDDNGTKVTPKGFDAVNPQSIKLGYLEGLNRFQKTETIDNCTRSITYVETEKIYLPDSTKYSFRKAKIVASVD